MELCEELRQTAGDAGNGLDRESRDALSEAVDEIERLREALKPFADYQLNLVADALYSLRPGDLKECLWVGGFSGPQPEYRHFDNARAALKRS